MTESHTVVAEDGHAIRIHSWLPADAPVLVVQILHGMGEHVGRYEEFASALNSVGIAVFAHNHRGHGEHAGLRGHFADRDGWQRVVEDARAVNEYAAAQFPGVPLVLFGHSMGSFVAQDFTAQFGSGLAGLVLSGSTWPNRLALVPGWLMTRLILLSKGRRGYSAALDRQGFEVLNKRFEPARTEADWLTRDEARVDQYLNDPRCGGPFTVGYWLDFIGGLMRVGSDSLLTRIRSDLPILILGGGDDPVGGDKGMGKLMTHYAQTGHQRLDIKIYPGARHEMLNETNRDDAIQDIAAWLQKLALQK